MWEASFGNASEARRSATSALELSKSREVEYGAAFALALAGDSGRSQELANDLERRFPEDTSVRFSYLPALRALYALSHSEPSKATELLQAALPHDLAVTGVSFFGFFGNLYPAYVRGEPIWQQTGPRKPPPSSRKSLITEESSSPILSVRWPI